MKVINQHIDQIVKLCEFNKVRALFAFGSVTTEKFRADSDIDLVVDIDDNDPISYPANISTSNFNSKIY